MHGKTVIFPCIKKCREYSKSFDKGVDHAPSIHEGIIADYAENCNMFLQKFLKSPSFFVFFIVFSAKSSFYNIFLRFMALSSQNLRFCIRTRIRLKNSLLRSFIYAARASSFSISALRGKRPRSYRPPCRLSSPRRILPFPLSC